MNNLKFQKKGVFAFLLFSLILIANGCIRESLEYSSLPSEKATGVTFVINIPSVKTPSTRTMGGSVESLLESVDILVFDVDDSDPSDVSETFLYHTTGTIVSNTLVGSTYTAEFKADLAAASDCRIVIVANAAAKLTGVIGTINAGDPKKSILEKLIISQLSLWEADAANDDYTAIPMYGETDKTSINPGGRFDNIEMRRMLARIDLRNDAVSDFTLEKIYLCNYNTVGYIAPAWRSADGQIIAPSVPSPNLPASPGKQSGVAHEYELPDPSVSQYFEGEIYAFESPAASDATESDRRNATCVIVEGKYENKTYYYRIDFTFDGGDGTDAGSYMPLLRNYKYILTITEAQGPGYDTFNEALNSYTVLSNLRTRIIYYDMGRIRDVNFDGQYMLGVESDMVEISKEARQLTVPVFTDVPDGWSAVIPAHSGSWLKFASGNIFEKTGYNNNLTGLVLAASLNDTGAPRTATVELTAGRLTKTITVIQTEWEGRLVLVSDINDKNLETIDFLTEIGESAPAQYYKVIWGPSSASLYSIKGVSSDENGIPRDEIEWNSWRTVIGASDDTSTDVFLATVSSSGKIEFTIEPVPIPASMFDNDPFYERHTLLTYLSSGGDESQKQLLIRQGGKNMAIETTEPDWLLDGEEKTVIVKSNVPWTLTVKKNQRTDGTAAIQDIPIGDALDYFVVSGKPNLPSGTVVNFKTIKNFGTDESGHNITPTPFDGELTLELTSTESSVVATRTIDCFSGVQDPSNCYIINANGKRNVILIPIERVVQGIAAVNATGSQPQLSFDKTGAWTTEVVWQTWRAITGENNQLTLSKASDDYLLLTANAGIKNANNAVICIKNTSGTIVWVWHIWFTDYLPPSDVVVEGENQKIAVEGGHVYRYTSPNAGANIFMDRNLGAGSGNRNDGAKTFGLFYQWGRHTAFPAPANPSSGGNMTTYTGALDAAGSISMITSLAAVSVPNSAYSSSNTLSYAISNPLVVIITSGTTEVTTNGDWYTNAVARQNNFIWAAQTTNTKTIFDPCPKGWMVPPYKTTNSAVSDSPWYRAGTNPYNGTNYGKTGTQAGGIMFENPDYNLGFYPKQGWKEGASNSIAWDERVLLHTGGVVRYTNSVTGAYFQFTGTNDYMEPDRGKAYSYPIRCVREK